MVCHVSHLPSNGIIAGPYLSNRLCVVRLRRQSDITVRWTSDEHQNHQTTTPRGKQSSQATRLWATRLLKQQNRRSRHRVT